MSYKNCYALFDKGIKQVSDVSVGSKVLSMGYDGYDFIETVLDITNSEIITDGGVYTHKGQGVCGKTATSQWIEPLTRRYDG